MFNSDLFINIWDSSSVVKAYKEMLNSYFSEYYNTYKHNQKVVIPNIFLTLKVISDWRNAIIEVLH